MSAVIYVESEDDLRSILARIERVSSDTIGIVVPVSRTPLFGPVSLRLLRRQAEAVGLDLGLVTPDPSLQEQARAEGIPVYRSPAAYERAVRQRAASGAKRLAPDAVPSGASWATGVALIVVALLVVVAVLIAVPEMSVAVSPRTRTLSQTIRVTADPSQTSVDVDRQRVPARRVQVVADAVDSIAPGEGEPVGDGKSRGMVTFTNRTQEQIEIATGAFISTSLGTRFATEDKVTVPAGIGQMAKGPVVAETPGEQGNVPRLRINVVLGDLDAKVYAQNEEPTAGGGIPGSRIVTAVDRDRLLKRVYDKARAESEAEMRKSLGPGETLLSQTVQFTPLETSFDGEVGEEARSLGVHFRSEATGTAVRSEDLARLGRDAWDPQAPPGFEVVPGSVSAGAPEVVGIDGQSVAVNLPLQATSRAIVDAGQIGQLTRWRSASDASRLLSRAYDLSRPPEISFTPGWAQRAFRVQVVVGAIASAATE